MCIFLMPEDRSIKRLCHFSIVVCDREVQILLLVLSSSDYVYCHFADIFYHIIKNCMWISLQFESLQFIHV